MSVSEGRFAFPVTDLTTHVERVGEIAREAARRVATPEFCCLERDQYGECGHVLPGRSTTPWSQVAADLLHLADRIEREHADDRFCACCSTDAIYLRDLAARYARKDNADA